MSLSYCTIAIVGAIVIGKQPDAYYNLDRFTTSEKVCYASYYSSLLRHICCLQGGASVQAVT